MSVAFISYAQKDIKIAEKFSVDLAREGIKVWFDQQEILAGDSLLERIKDGIHSADYLIVLISENSNKSAWVEK